MVELNLPITPVENASLSVGNEFFYAGAGYLMEQGTKPGTISAVLMSNPVALLAWYVDKNQLGVPFHAGTNGQIGSGKCTPKAESATPSTKS